MLTAFALAVVLQQPPGVVIWREPVIEPPVVAETEPVSTPANLPDWALSDPFGWERAQCNPMIRGSVSLESCQARVRTELSSALGDRLPAALRPVGETMPCQQRPGTNGGFEVQCGTPERQMAAEVSPAIQDCRSRPQRQGGSAAFTTDCRPDSQSDSGGLSFRLFGSGKD